MANIGKSGSTRFDPEALFGRTDVQLDRSAVLLGPLWALRNGMWLTFAMACVVELIGLVLVAEGLWPAEGETILVDWLLGGAAVIVGMRLLLGYVAVFHRRRQIEIHMPARPARAQAAQACAVLAMIALYAITIYRFVASEPMAAVEEFPAPAGLDNAAAAVIDDAVDWAKRNWSGFFDFATWCLRGAMDFMQVLFIGTPWPVIVAVVLLLAWRLSGHRAVIFAAASLAYLGLFGFWEKSMETMALVATSVLLCVISGIPLGILCAKSGRTRMLIEPILDVMQTLPTFVYLIPAVAFFSIGKPPGVIATVIFAFPPIVRLTSLGIQQVPVQVREAADAFGAKWLQTLFKVELPLAFPSIRLGINQTIMMCLSMVVVASMIGAGGLGLDVMRSLQALKTGQGFLAGFAIVVCAMVLDRVVRGKEK